MIRARIRKGHEYGVHWPDLDEDIGVEGLLLGKPSGRDGWEYRHG